MVKFAQLPKYEAYKDSGVDWIGSIPADWQLEKAKWLFTKADRPIRKDDEIVTCFRDGQVTLRKNRRTDGFTNALKEHGYQGIRKGDLVIHAMDAFAGAIGVSDSDGKSTPVYAACIPRRRETVNPYFYAYYMRDLALSGLIVSLAKGIRERSTDFRFNDFSNLTLPLPNYDQQTLIANFLDQKTAQIDAAIAIKEQQIELLKERKQIIIQQAVTQGLDPNVPMKDSGVEWIGQIPEHWEVKKLKHGLLLTNDKIESKKSQLKYLGMESVQAATGLLSGVDSEADGLANVFHSGQVLFGKLRPYLAKVYLAEFDGVCSTEFLVFEAKANYDRGYISKLLLSDGFIKTVDASTYGSKMPRANPNFILNTLLPSPPIIEQLQIHEYITNISGATESAIINTVEQIQKLKEYKTTLINSAVTGKIKVPGVV